MKSENPQFLKDTIFSEKLIWFEMLVFQKILRSTKWIVPNKTVYTTNKTFLQFMFIPHIRFFNKSILRFNFTVPFKLST